ncbi:MAG: thiamine pyrophosphate-dependent enzyme [Microgenomates group bacterium]
MNNLETNTLKTWCPGCGNFLILNTLKKLIEETEKEIGRENFVLVTGIGCHGKMADYLNINSFYALHGRGVAVATGIKIANPNLKVIVSVGDGDAYNEGIEHLIHAAKRNIPMVVLVHDNRTFALTTGQFTATSPLGFKGKSTPEGSKELPINPLKLMISVGAGFVARGYVGKPDHLFSLIKKALFYNGFAFIDILQPCLVFFNTFQDYNQRVYELEKPAKNLCEALEKAEEWNYEDGQGKIPVGIFYER